MYKETSSFNYHNITYYYGFNHNIRVTRNIKKKKNIVHSDRETDDDYTHSKQQRIQIKNYEQNNKILKSVIIRSCGTIKR